MAPSMVSTVTDISHARSKEANTQSSEPTGHHGHELASQTPLQALSHGPVKLSGVPSFSSVEAKRQWQLEHMAAVFRHWAREDYIEGMSGHISVRDPEFPNAFWTNPLGKHFGLLRASNMILVDYDGKVIGGNRNAPPNSTGFLIHGAVHKARPDVHAVCHAHGISGKAWSVFGRRLEMLTQDSCKFFGEAQGVYNSYGGLVLGPQEGEKIAEALGPKGKGVMLRNHGHLTVGATVDEAAFLFTSMERSCRVQLLVEAAAANGVPKVLITDEEAKFNFDVEGDAEVCYREFQTYYEWEESHSADFKN